MWDCIPVEVGHIDGVQVCRVGAIGQILFNPH